MFLCNDLLVCFDRTAGRKVLRTKLLKMEAERSIMIEFWYQVFKILPVDSCHVPLRKNRERGPFPDFS